MSTREVFEKFYAITATRFYSAKEQDKLIALIASSYGVHDNTDEFKSIADTVASVRYIGVEDLTECKNFLLITDSLPGKKELIKAVRAKKNYLERMARTGVVAYANAIDWRTSVYRDQSVSPEAKLEVAYIEYARGNSENAVKIFEKAADDDSNLLALEHAGVIHFQLGNIKDALYRFSTLESVLHGTLGIDCPSGISEFMREAENKLSDAEVKACRERADKRVLVSFRFNSTTKNAIGF